MKKLTEARNSFGFTNVWTQGGKILCNEDNRIKGFFWLTVCREATRRCSLKIAGPSCFYIQREKTHNFSGVLNIVCGKICFSSFFVNLQTNKPSLCWKDIGNKVIFQGFCEYNFKPVGSTSLFGAHSSKWLLPGCGKCTGQERCVKICAKEITEEKIGLFIVVVFFVRGVLLGAILHLVFISLMINGYTPLIEIFLFSSFTYYYFST